MPIPFLFIGPGVVSAVAGVGKTVKAVNDNSRAKKINESADDKIKRAANRLDRPRRQCGEALESLGKEKMEILNTSVNEFLVSFEKLKNVEFMDSEDLHEFDKLHIDRDVFEKLKEMENVASLLASGTIAGAVGGAFAAFGAYNTATTFATASSGTAIASLSGAAATNATLAFFGGGSLAAGGLGMAGGTAVLGGLVAGPALLVMGVVTGAKASKNLDNAYSNKAKAEEICEQLDVAVELCVAIRRRTYMFYSLLARLDTYFIPLIYQLKEAIKKEGTDYAAFTPEAKQTVAAAASIAVTIKAALDTPILTEEGNLTNESKRMVDGVISVVEGVKQGSDTDTFVDSLMTVLKNVKAETDISDETSEKNAEEETVKVYGERACVKEYTESFGKSIDDVTVIGSLAWREDRLKKIRARHAAEQQEKEGDIANQ